jgi:hypothetical protein
MRPLRILLFTLFLGFLSHLTWSQGHDVLPAAPGDAVKVAKFFPNPATEYLNLKFETSLAKDVKVTVHNIIGNIIEVEIEVVEDQELRLKVKDLPAGVYLLALKEDGRAQSCIKFLKR